MTRSDALQRYAAALKTGPDARGATSGMECVAFEVLCNDLELIGFQRGYAKAEQTGLLLDALVSERPLQFPPDVADPLDPIDVPDGRDEPCHDDAGEEIDEPVYDESGLVVAGAGALL